LIVKKGGAVDLGGRGGAKERGYLNTSWRRLEARKVHRCFPRRRINKRGMGGGEANSSRKSKYGNQKASGAGA